MSNYIIGSTYDGGFIYIYMINKKYIGRSKQEKLYEDNVIEE